MSAGTGSPPPKPHGSTPEKTGWPKLLSLAVHEFRSPLTVVSGYLRMLLKERAGPLPEQQRRLLEEAEKSCARLSVLLAELSDLSNLEAGIAAFNRSRVDVHAALVEVIQGLPPLPDRPVSIELSGTSSGVHGDATRLKSALTSILLALRRELVSSDRLGVRVETTTVDSRPSVLITIADAERVDRLTNLQPADLATFDEWRGGNGLGLLNARRIIEAHAGRIRSTADDGKAVALIALPAVE
jgi:signal transduction histidine kinase